MVSSRGQTSGQTPLDAGGVPASLTTRSSWIRPVDSQTAEDPPHQQEVVPRGRKCVLLVDDEEFIIQVGQEMLDSLGYDAVTRLCSAEALETFRVAPQHFDLVITDYQMPDMTGDVLAQALRCLRPDVPIILCTGSSAMTSDKIHALGFDACLRKPFGPHDIALAIEKAMAQRMMQKI